MGEVCYLRLPCGLGTDVQYRVEPREVKARLDSPVVMSVMALGHSRDLIRQAIQRRLTTTGLTYTLFVVFRFQFILLCLSDTIDYKLLNHTCTGVHFE